MLAIEAFSFHLCILLRQCLTNTIKQVNFVFLFVCMITVIWNVMKFGAGIWRFPLVCVIQIGVHLQFEMSVEQNPRNYIEIMKYMFVCLAVIYSCPKGHARKQNSGINIYLFAFPFFLSIYLSIYLSISFVALFLLFTYTLRYLNSNLHEHCIHIIHRGGSMQNICGSPLLLLEKNQTTVHFDMSRAQSFFHR